MLGKEKPKTRRKSKGISPRLAAAMIDHTRTKAVTLCLTRHGPLYARAVIPDYAKADFERKDYSAWYVGHLDVDCLTQEHMQSHVRDFFREGGFLDGPDGLEDFMLFLEKKGYVVLHSAYEPGVIVLDTTPAKSGPTG